jgi:hypothetical protein
VGGRNVESDSESAAALRVGDVVVLTGLVATVATKFSEEVGLRTTKAAGCAILARCGVPLDPLVLAGDPSTGLPPFLRWLRTPAGEARTTVLAGWAKLFHPHLCAWVGGAGGAAARPRMDGQIITSAAQLETAPPDGRRLCTLIGAVLAVTVASGADAMYTVAGEAGGDPVTLQRVDVAFAPLHSPSAALTVVVWCFAQSATSRPPPGRPSLAVSAGNVHRAASSDAAMADYNKVLRGMRAAASACAPVVIMGLIVGSSVATLRGGGGGSPTCVLNTTPGTRVKLLAVGRRTDNASALALASNPPPSQLRPAGVLAAEGMTLEEASAAACASVRTASHAVVLAAPARIMGLAIPHAGVAMVVTGTGDSAVATALPGSAVLPNRACLVHVSCAVCREAVEHTAWDGARVFHCAGCPGGGKPEWDFAPLLLQLKSGSGALWVRAERGCVSALLQPGRTGLSAAAVAGGALAAAEASTAILLALLHPGNGEVRVLLGGAAAGLFSSGAGVDKTRAGEASGAAQPEWRQMDVSVSSL